MRDLTRTASRIVVALLFLATSVSGAPVTQQQAAKAAETFLVRFYPAASDKLAQTVTPFGKSHLAVRNVRTLVEAGETVGFIADLEPSGYVVLSTDDDAPAIKLHADNGAFDSLPPAILRVIRLELAEDLSALAELKGLNKTTNSGYKKQWSALTEPASHSAELAALPLAGSGSYLLTTSWNQDNPYNRNCPNCPGGYPNYNGRAPVGCNAIAIGQILRYKRRPERIAQDHTYSDIWGDCQHTFSISASSMYPDWDNMPNAITTSSPDDQQQAIGRFLKQVAVAMESDFEATITTAYLSRAPGVFRDFFLYANNGVELRSGYTTTQWYNKIVADINADKPIYYYMEPTTSDAGHVVVCDGYATGNQIHMNFGWGGASTAWYGLDSVIDSNGTHWIDHIAVFGITPPGSLKVVISPQAAVDAGAAWRVDGGTWNCSGCVEDDVIAGNNTVEFSALAGWTAPPSQTVTITTLQTNTVYGSYVQQGAVQVTITPQGAIDAGALWRVDSGSWRVSGDVAAGLSPGSHTVEFNTISLWDSPSPQSVTVVGGQTNMLTNNYVRQSGSLQVTINPWCAVEGGAKWQVNGGPWQGTGSTISGLPTGQYTVHFSSLPTGTSPSDELVTIYFGQATVTDGTYSQSIAPSPPSNLTATLVSPMQVKLTWQDNSDIETGFRIERAEFADGPWTQIAQGSPNTTTFRNTGLFPSMAYYYRVRAYNCAGDSDYCDQASASTPALLCVSVVGWGYNLFGQAAPPPDLSNVVAIAAGGLHSLGLKSDGTVVGWGCNDYGQATPSPNLSNAVAIAASWYGSLALRSDGTVVGWGDETPPAGLSGIVAIAASGSLALRSDGTVVGWGDNAFGETNTPEGLSSVVQIAAGLVHRLALKSDGTVVGWGYNGSGEATPPPNLSNVVAIAAGCGHSLALIGDGTVFGWGYNGSGEATGEPSTNSPWAAAGPVTIAGKPLSNVVAIAAGCSYSLALKNDGEVVGWGDNSYGGTDEPAGLLGVTAIAAGAYHSLGIACVPNAPSALTATVNGSQINLVWNDNSDNEENFAIERATSAGGAWEEIARTDSNTTVFGDSNVSCGQTYFYRVRACLGAGGSPYSEIASANTSADTDGDGLLDCWMERYFGHPLAQVSDRSRPQDDADGDGLTNLQEYLAGTDPTNAYSALRITGCEQLEDGSSFRITWSCVAGKSYQVTYSDSPEGPWLEDLPNSEPTAGESDVTLSYIDCKTSGVTQRFYQVRLVPGTEVTGGTVNVTVTDYNGPLRGWRVFILYAGGEDQFVGTTDEAGHLVITNVPVGGFTVIARHPSVDYYYGICHGAIAIPGDVVHVTVFITWS
jgi:hypothetical protein